MEQWNQSGQQGGYFPPPSPGGYAPPPSGPMPPPWYKTPKGMLVLGGGLFLLIAFSCGRRKDSSDEARVSQATPAAAEEDEASQDCRSAWDKDKKLASCMMVCGKGAKWACDVAEQLKTDKAAEQKLKLAEAERKAATPPPSEARAAVADMVEKPSAPSTPTPSEPDDDTPAPSGGGATFPDVVKKFAALNELKQDEFKGTFKGTVLRGSGKVSEVEKCGFLDDSEKWDSDCVKVILQEGNARVALYYGPSDKAKVSNYSKGDRVTFSNCVANSIRDWGFWSTATCDMP